MSKLPNKFYLFRLNHGKVIGVEEYTDSTTLGYGEALVEGKVPFVTIEAQDAISALGNLLNHRVPVSTGLLRDLVRIINHNLAEGGAEEES